jgi:hypothetical protein
VKALDVKARAYLLALLGGRGVRDAARIGSRALSAATRRRGKCRWARRRDLFDRLATVGLRRGTLVETPGGGRGRYVGTTDKGLQYIAYTGEDFAAVCLAFDALGARRAT